MKKLLGILLVALFVFSIVFTINSNITTKISDSPVYATVLPIPPPPKPGRGC